MFGVIRLRGLALIASLAAMPLQAMTMVCTSPEGRDLKLVIADHCECRTTNSEHATLVAQNDDGCGPCTDSLLGLDATPNGSSRHLADWSASAPASHPVTPAVATAFDASWRVDPADPAWLGADALSTVILLI